MMSEKHLTLEQINAHFQPKGYTFVSLSEDKSGFINKTIFLEEKSGKNYVLRLCSTLETFKTHKTLNEVRSFEFVGKIGTVPAPVTCDFDSTTDNPFNCEYILMTKLEGEQLSKVVDSMTPAEIEALMYEFAKMFKPVWSKRFDLIGPLDDTGKPGEVLFAGIQGPFKTRQGFLTSSLATIIEGANANGSRKEELIQKLRERIFEKEEKPPVFICFAHSDLKFDNLLFKDGHISGVVDWEWAGAMPFEMEIFNTDFYRLEKYREKFLDVLNEAMELDVRKAMNESWEYHVLNLGTLVLLWHKMWGITKDDPLVVQWVAELEKLMKKYNVFDGKLLAVV